MSGEELIGVAHVSDRAEAEMIQGLLQSAGIPSVLQHVGIDGPTVGIGLLNPGGGSRRVMVHARQSEAARALLEEAAAEGEAVVEMAGASEAEETEGRKPRDYNVIGAYARAWAWSLGVMGLAFALFMLLRST